MSGVLTPVETRIFLSLQTGCVVDPVFFKIDTFHLSRGYSDQGVVLNTHALLASRYCVVTAIILPPLLTSQHVLWRPLP